VSGARLPERGDVFADLQIDEELGRGGMGVVYRAEDLRLHTARALKVIDPELSSDDLFVARFRREARLAAAIDHPNVVAVHRAGEEGGLLYIVATLVDGEDLEKVLAEGPLPVTGALTTVEQVAAALGAAHDRGLVHRDVKPANVLVERSSGRALLTDFGISKPLASRGESETAVTSGAEVLGTADYVAPELIEGEHATERSDVYSLACFAYAALTGHPPFQRSTELATLVAHTKAERPRASEESEALPAAVDDVLAKGMAIEPSHRYASPAEFAHALRVAVTGRIAPTPGDRRRLALLIVLAVLAAAGAGVALALRDGGGEPPPTNAREPEDGRRVPSPSVATQDVGAGPLALATGGDEVFVASRDEGSVETVALDSLDPIGRPLQVPTPVGIATGFDSTWTVSTEALYRARDDGSAPVRIAAGERPSSIAVDDAWVWVADEAGNNVLRVDPKTNEVTATVPVPDEPRALAAANGSVWVACAGDGSVVRIDVDTAKVTGEPSPAGSRPTAIAVGSGQVWVADNEGARLFRFDEETGDAPGKPIEVGPKPRGVAVDDDVVWVASGQSGTVARFSAATGEAVGDPIPVGTDPADVAVSDGVAFTANFGDSTVARIAP
jgi:DNA-binding beta-propeller fold protein YncE/tRNA A-37 threonylcarbamoyl transferase component Bud32